LCVNYRRRHAFSENEQHVLGLAAQLAAVALRNAERHVLSAELAVKEERHRLAGQLHDSVSQYVPAIQLMADTGLKLMRDQPDQTAHWLERIQDAAQQTMTEIRINLFETRVSTTRSRNLRQALQESAKLAHEYFGLEVDISPKSVPKQLRIPIEAELLLICREAITNAARHSGAKRVTVDLSEINGQVRLHVEDNGCGFDVEALSVQGLRGLELMRERVERMQGHLSIQSGRGEGTAIEATIPI
ncbi:MAG TPA: sensor histidine kinase, partial [Anaerolineae bacterium]